MFWKTEQGILLDIQNVALAEYFGNKLRTEISLVLMIGDAEKTHGKTDFCIAE